MRHELILLVVLVTCFCLFSEHQWISLCWQLNYLHNDNELLDIKQKELQGTINRLLQSKENFVKVYEVRILIGTMKHIFYHFYNFWWHSWSSNWVSGGSRLVLERLLLVWTSIVVIFYDYAHMYAALQYSAITNLYISCSGETRKSRKGTGELYSPPRYLKINEQYIFYLVSWTS